MIVDTPLPVLLETLKVNTGTDMRAELQKIQVPALIIHGDQDASAPIDLTGRKTAELIGGAGCRAPQKRRKNFAGTAAVYLARLASW